MVLGETLRDDMRRNTRNDEVLCQVCNQTAGDDGGPGSPVWSESDLVWPGDATSAMSQTLEAGAARRTRGGMRDLEVLSAIQRAKSIDKELGLE